jgi:hypothetical protein
MHVSAEDVLLLQDYILLSYWPSPLTCSPQRIKLSAVIG